MVVPWICAIRTINVCRMPTIVPADSVSSLSSRSLGDPFVEIAWLSTATLEQYERLIERDDSFAGAVLRWLAGWFYKNDKATNEEECNMRDISIENFMVKLETGVVLCRMAQLLVAQARNLGRPILNKCVPSFEFKPWLRASPRSFYARDNVENFTRWCRKFGVHESVLFESDGLVMHQTPRYVLLVLLELCRLCAQLGVDPPSVEAQKRNERARIQQERERIRRLEQEHKEQQQKQKEEMDRIRRQQIQEAAEKMAEEQRLLEEKRLQEECAIREREAEENELSKITEKEEQFEDEEEEDDVGGELDALRQQEICSTTSFEEPSASPIAPDSGFGTPTAVCYAESVMMTFDGQDQSSGANRSFRSRLPVPVRGVKSEPASQPTSILDEKVHTIVNKVLKGAKLHRLSEGKYLIDNRQCLVRLLNDKQVMVRVGGGWESLEEKLRPRKSGRERSSFRRRISSESSAPIDPVSALKSLPKAKGISSSSSFLSSRNSDKFEMTKDITTSQVDVNESTKSFKYTTRASDPLSALKRWSPIGSRITVGNDSRPRWK